MLPSYLDQEDALLSLVRRITALLLAKMAPSLERLRDALNDILQRQARPILARVLKFS